MGRWSQRRHCGGGTPATVPIAQITLASIIDSNRIDLTYDRDIDATTLTPAGFESHGSNQVATTASQAASNEAIVIFPGDISTDFEVVYSGSDAGFLTPQSVSYS